MKWSDYTSQLDTVHAPDALKQRLSAMETQADPADAPRFAPAKKHKATRVRFGQFKLWQVAAALALCVGLGAVLPLPSLFGMRSAAPMDLTPNGNVSGMAMDAGQPEGYRESTDETAALQDTADSVSLAATRSANPRKIIYTAELSLESTEYDVTRTALAEALAQTNGYVQQTEEYTRPGDVRYVRCTYRIPVEQYQEFLQQVALTGNLILSRESTDDVTAQYVDTRARVDALTAQRDRLLALQDKAENLDDLLAIEEQLTSAQYELESWQAQLDVLLNQTDYCTVNLELSEVKVYTPVETNLLQKIGYAFRDAVIQFGEALTGILLWVIGCWPWLILIGLCSWLLLRGRIRRRRHQPPEK